MNILIVEDSLVIQRLYSELMKGWGYEFDIAANGMEAIAFVQKNNGKYDLCLMDIEMPIMNGIEATRVIRKISNYFPIMAITANEVWCGDVTYIWTGHRWAYLVLVMDSYARKPDNDGLSPNEAENRYWENSKTVAQFTWPLH